MLSSYSKNLHNFYWKKKKSVIKPLFPPLLQFVSMAKPGDLTRCQISGLIWEWMPSNFFQSSTFSACLILLGILLARHCLEEFNRIKGLLFKPKKDSQFLPKNIIPGLGKTRNCYDISLLFWTYEYLDFQITENNTSSSSTLFFFSLDHIV